MRTCSMPSAKGENMSEGLKQIEEKTEHKKWRHSITAMRWLNGPGKEGARGDRKMLTQNR